MIRITAKRDGYRRAGIAHSKAPTDHAADRFSKAGLAQLKADPNLTVEMVEDATAEKKTAGKKAAEKTAAKKKAATPDALQE